MRLRDTGSFGFAPEVSPGCWLGNMMELIEMAHSMRLLW